MSEIPARDMALSAKDHQCGALIATARWTEANASDSTAQPRDIPQWGRASLLFPRTRRRGKCHAIASTNWGWKQHIRPTWTPVLLISSKKPPNTQHHSVAFTPQHRIPFVNPHRTRSKAAQRDNHIAKHIRSSTMKTTFTQVVLLFASLAVSTMAEPTADLKDTRVSLTQCQDPYH